MRKIDKPWVVYGPGKCNIGRKKYLNGDLVVRENEALSLHLNHKEKLGYFIYEDFRSFLGAVGYMIKNDSWDDKGLFYEYLIEKYPDRKDGLEKLFSALNLLDGNN